MVIIKKILRAIDHLPVTAEDLHQHSSAHGSFFDTLFGLGAYSDYEVSESESVLPTHNSRSLHTQVTIGHKPLSVELAPEITSFLDMEPCCHL